MNNNKKRMMFILGEDYNLLLYRIICILDFYKCYTPEKKFKDIRKLASVIQFMDSSNSVELFNDAYNKSINLSDREMLYKVNLKTKIVSADVYKIIHALELKVNLNIIKEDDILSVYMIENEKLVNFARNEMFNEDKLSIKRMQKVMRSLRTVSYDTYYKNIFKDNGVV